jgi:hypothetical protein
MHARLQCDTQHRGPTCKTPRRSRPAALCGFLSFAYHPSAESQPFTRAQRFSRVSASKTSVPRRCSSHGFAPEVPVPR